MVCDALAEKDPRLMKGLQAILLAELMYNLKNIRGIERIYRRLITERHNPIAPILLELEGRNSYAPVD